MIASLFMYNYPQLTEPHARFWTLIRKRLGKFGIDSPASLNQQSGTAADWEDPGLFFSQTCGLPYRLRLHDKVELIGTPDYGLDSCPPGYYCSVLLVRASDPRTRFDEYRNAVLAFNSTDSQSGYGAPYWHALTHGFWFEKRLETGSHLFAAHAVANGAADIAALDAVSWTIIQRYTDFTAQLRILDQTAATPGLPYITGLTSDTQAMFDAVAAAIDDLSSADRDRLLIKNIVHISKEKYMALKIPG